jgi:predicted DsbA family dithiol-disulfide isomerase
VTLNLDVVSDVVCPWCYIGKRRLERAAELVPAVDLKIRYRPFQLDAAIPREGLERKAYMEAKLGGPAAVAVAHERIAEIGEELGIPFDFEAISVAPNTLDAHRLIRWAGEAGIEADVVERLFHAYFVAGEDIGDAEVLADIGAAAGLDRDEVARWLATDADRDDVTAEVAEAQRIGVTGVPCTIVEGRYAVMGAQEPAALARAFSEIAEEKKFGVKS